MNLTSLHTLITRLEDRDTLVEVAAKALYERDEENRDPVSDRDYGTPWEGTPEDIRQNYRADMAVVVDALLAHLRGAP